MPDQLKRSMKILQLCNKAPYPPKDGGAIAIMILSESFAELGHQVTVLAMNTTKHKSDVQSIPSQISDKIKFKYIDVDTRLNPVNLLINFLFSKLPYIAERFIQPKFSRELENILKNDDFDIVQLEGLYLMPYIKVIRKCCSARIAFRAHNIENEIWERIAGETSNPLKKVYLSSLSKRLKRFEYGFLNRYDLLIPITTRDGEKLSLMGNTKPVFVCPAGVPYRNFNKTISYIPNSLFYIGALDWIPNQEAIVWFLDNVWHQLKEKLPAIQFHVAGRNSPQWLQKKCVGQNIFFHGEIDDAHVFFDKYQIMVVPLFAGSGMRLKIVEAMARSKVVITTSIGAEGLETVNGKHLLVQDTAEGFVKQILFLLENPEYSTKIEKDAFQLAVEKYNSQIITESLTMFYKQQLAC